MEQYKELYLKWKDSPMADAETKAELAAIENDENEIYDRFYCPLGFGTAGMRGLIGAGTNRMNRYTVRKATLGYARYLKQYGGDDVGYAEKFKFLHKSLLHQPHAHIQKHRYE